MNRIKTQALSATLAAASLVGAIGFAYAQTTEPVPAQTEPSAQQQQQLQQDQTMPAQTDAQPSGTLPSDSSSVPAAEQPWSRLPPRCAVLSSRP